MFSPARHVNSFIQHAPRHPAGNTRGISESGAFSGQRGRMKTLSIFPRLRVSVGSTEAAPVPRAADQTG
jgi:hypothetical protein